MEIKVRVVPRASRNEVIVTGGAIKVCTTSPAAGNRANEAVVALLAGHFNVSKRSVSIVRGLKSRNKTVRILQD